MCINYVQMKFFSLKAKWTFRDLWEHLKKRYSLIERSFKWAVFNNLKMLINELFIADLESKILNVLVELKSQNLIIEQIVILKVFNTLKSSFFIYLIVIMKSVRKENKFLFLTNLFQNLANEENRQRAEKMINFIKKIAEIKENNQRSNKQRDKKMRTRKMIKTTQMTKMTKNALNVTAKLIQRTNAQWSILNVQNVIKLIIKSRCVESKRNKTINQIRNYLLETTKSKMNHLSLRKSH